MKKYTKLYLLLIVTIISIMPALAQSSNLAAYSDPDVSAAMDFLMDRLPMLVENNDIDTAIDEYMLHLENLNKLDEADLMYLMGHFYSIMDVPRAIPYFELLMEDPRLGEDARSMLHLLIYQRAAEHIQKRDPREAAEFLEDVMNKFSTGRYYPTYLFLWADLLAEEAEDTRVQRYVDAYEANKDWIKNTFVTKRKAIVQRLDDLDLKAFYSKPDQAGAEALKNRVDKIQEDLRDLYNEFQAIPGLMFSDAIKRISNEEMSALDRFKAQIKPFESVPPIDLEYLASTDPNDPDAAVFARYREGAQNLKAVKDYSDLINKTLDIIDRFFENQYEIFISQSPTAASVAYSDLELKRLMDIERNIYLYTDVVAGIEELMSDPNYASLNIDMEPERQEYLEKIAELQNRKERYLAIRSSQDSVEERIFMELLEEYYATTRDKRTLDELLPDLEDVMLAMIQKNFPQDQKDVIEQEYLKVQKVGLEDFPVDATFLANLDFLNLIMDYRKVHHKEQERLKNIDQIGEAEQQTQYQAIIHEKSELLGRHEYFVSSNPGFKAMEQPSGGYLLNTAVIYYNMAELQYAVDLDNPEKALANYRRVLQINPDFHLRDRVLYNIGYLSSEAKKADKYSQIEAFRVANPHRERPEHLKFSQTDFTEAIDAYIELADSEKYEDSPFYDEAIYRLGILNFLIGSDADQPVQYYEEANRRFDVLVTNPQSDYHFDALYQRAWVNMNQGDEEALKLALQDFVTLMDAADTSKIRDEYLAQDYRINSIDNIAYSLIALDGLDFHHPSKGISEMNTVMAGYSDIKVKSLVLEKAAELKVELDAPLQAIDFMELKLHTSPLELTNPAVVDSIIKLYHTPGLQLRPGTDLARIRNQKYDDVKRNYGKGTAWYNQNVKDKNLGEPVLAQQLEVIHEAYEHIRIRHYNDLLDSASDEDKTLYDGHVASFEGYEELFESPESLLAFKNQNRRSSTILASVMAEKRNTPRDYQNAIQVLRAYNEDFEHNPDYFNNEGLIYQYTQNIFTELNPQFDKSGFKPAAGLPQSRKDLYEKYRDASLKFYSVLLNSSNPDARSGAPAILMELADVELKQDSAPAAKTRYMTILDSGIRLDQSTSRSLYLNLAQIEENAGNYSEAERMYVAAKDFADDSADADEIENLVRLQIQNNYEKAEKTGDYQTVARELMRLSEKFANEPARSQGYVFQASEAYLKAGEYNRAIELKTGLARQKTSLDEKYALYEQSWSISQDKLKDPVKTQALKNEFIRDFPSSNYAFLLRVDLIEEMRKEPAKLGSAAQMYLDLHRDVKAGSIDSGEVTPQDVYLWAVDIYRDQKNEDKVIETLSYFVQTYPTHLNTVDFLALLADTHLARGDEDNFELYARELYLKDKTKSDRYMVVANRKLGALAQDFDAAYEEKNWNLAFDKRDDFKAQESKYLAEGLRVNTTKAHEAFSFAEKEYAAIQARQDYLTNFDLQLNSIEKGGFLTSTPNQLITVNAMTTWQQHLFGGAPNRVPAFKERTEREVQKIVNLLQNDQADHLDNERRLRALSLIAKINDHAANVVETQIDKYIQTTNEMAGFRDRRQYSQAQFDRLLDEQILPYSQPYVDLFLTSSSSIYLDIYNNYFTAGYYDKYTNTAEDKLLERNLLPDYAEEPYPLNEDWKISLVKPNGSSQKLNISSFGLETMANGRDLVAYEIPSGHNLLLEREFSFSAKPEFAYLYLVYDQQPQITLNSSNLDPVYIPVDELTPGKVYALRIPGDAFRDGKNSFRGSFPNSTAIGAPIRFGASFFFEADDESYDLFLDTQNIVSDPDWIVIVKDPETGEDTRSYAVVTEYFNLPVDKSNFLTDESALPIWVQETQDFLYETVIFEKQFELEAELLEAHLDFVAPNSALILLNDKPLGQAYQMDYNTEPFEAKPIRVGLPAASLRAGLNTLRIEVHNNSSLNRGMIAQLSLIQFSKE